MPKHIDLPLELESRIKALVSVKVQRPVIHEVPISIAMSHPIRVRLI